MTIHDKSFLLSETQGGFNLFLMFLSTHCSMFLQNQRINYLLEQLIYVFWPLRYFNNGDIFTFDRKLIKMELLDDTQVGCCHWCHASLAFVGMYPVPGFELILILISPPSLHGHGWSGPGTRSSNTCHIVIF